MDAKRKKDLLLQWKNRRPEMGLISITCKSTGEMFGLIAITCKSTGEMFVDISTDTQFAFNSHRFKLSANFHPNKRLQQLWQQYGENGFDYAVVKILKYENKDDDQTEKLTLLLEEYLAQTPQARRLSK